MPRLTAQPVVQFLGIAATLLYGTFVAWLYATQPRSIAELQTAAAVQANVYTIDQAQFDEAMRAFRQGQFQIAVDHFARADPARRDPKTQFLIAYAHYAVGRGTLYDDDKEFQAALEAVDRCLAVAPNNTYTIDEPGLTLDYTSADRLRQRLREGLEVTPGDLNPFKKGDAR
jgi:tetratricopeptide (TPR) repeat protein